MYPCDPVSTQKEIPMSPALTVRQFGSLKCRVVENDEAEGKPPLLVILNHGFGASGEDLVDFGPWLMEGSEPLAATCRFVFPEAPIELSSLGMPGARAWWPINMAKLAEINQSQNFDELTRLNPSGMDTATSQLEAAVREMQREWGHADADCVIGGFSQGAMVSTNLILEAGLQPALLTLCSGTLLNRERWTQLADSHSGCQVLQSHGDQDLILPRQPAIDLSQLLSNAGFEVEFLTFRGPHTIPLQVLSRFRERLEEIAGKL